MTFITEDIIKLLISAGTGAIIGLEREYHSKSAGLRTMILICLGSTIFTIISMKLGSDPSRIAANIVTGIGFVGGGIILETIQTDALLASLRRQRLGLQPPSACVSVLVTGFMKQVL